MISCHKANATTVLRRKFGTDNTKKLSTVLKGLQQKHGYVQSLQCDESFLLNASQTHASLVNVTCLLQLGYYSY